MTGYCSKFPNNEYLADKWFVFSEVCMNDRWRVSSLSVFRDTFVQHFVSSSSFLESQAQAWRSCKVNYQFSVVYIWYIFQILVTIIEDVNVNIQTATNNSANLMSNNESVRAIEFSTIYVREKIPKLGFY